MFSTTLSYVLNYSRHVQQEINQQYYNRSRIDNRILTTITATSNTTTGRIIIGSLCLVLSLYTISCIRIIQKYHIEIRKQLDQIHNSIFFSLSTSSIRTVIKKYTRKYQKSTKDPFHIIRIPIPKRNNNTTTSSPNCSFDESNNNTITDSLSSSTELSNHIKLLDLDIDFYNKHTKNGNWNFISLGEYLSSLRPYLLPTHKTTTNKFNNHSSQQQTTTISIDHYIEKEIQAALATALLRSIGIRYGTLLLPVLSISSLQVYVEKIATLIASYMYTSFVLQSTILVPSTKTQSNTNTNTSTTISTLYNDIGGIPISLVGIMYSIELHYQRIKATKNRKKVVEQHQQQKEQQEEEQKRQGTTSSTSSGVKKLFSSTSKVLSMVIGQKKSNTDTTSTFKGETKVTTNIKTALQLLYDGEVGYDKSFANQMYPSNDDSSVSTSPSTTGCTNNCDGQYLIPNPFIISKHWDCAMHGMEQLLSQQLKEEQQQQQDYNPHCRKMPEPIPIDQRILPDLYFGWGNAQCTHTQREILYNRLLSILLNKLAYNYYYLYDSDTTTGSTCSGKEGTTALFVVQMNEDNDTPIEIVTPVAFIQALVDCGHTIETCINTNGTTFGIALCIKETEKDETDNDDDDDNDALAVEAAAAAAGVDHDSTIISSPNNKNNTRDKWSNIPLAIFLQNGCTDKTGQNDAYVRMQHSGLNLEIRGPLFNNGHYNTSCDGINIDNDATDNENNNNETQQSTRCSVQHYLAIEGLCGWHSNHNANVPWLQDIECSPRMTGQQALDSIGIAAMVALVQNTVATLYELPSGGYGLTGVCNDSAAIIEYSIFNTTNVYPLTFNGKFSMYLLRVAKDIRNSLQKQKQKQLQQQQLQTEPLTNTSNVDNEINALNKIINAIKELPSDSSCLSLPYSLALDQCRRQLHCIPSDIPFTLMKYSQQIIKDVQNEMMED